MGRPVVRASLRIAAAVALLATAACRPAAPEPRPPAPAPAAPARVVGYFTDWGIYGRDYQVRDVDTSGAAARLTHLVYAFGKVRDGRCTAGNPWADHQAPVPAASSVDGVVDTGPLRGTIGQLRKLKQHHPRLKVLWSFGGWTGSGGFGAAARDPEAFAAACHTLLTDPRWAGVFDGIDIDWEYPNACGLSCDTSGPDALARLLAALRARFGAGAVITAAVPGDVGKLAKADYAGAATHADWLSAMTYDYFGTGGGTGPTAAHAPLTAYPGIPRAAGTADATVQTLLAAGVPPGKVLLGIGFYGRGWTGVSGPAPGGRATGPAPGTYQKGLEDYRVLRERCPPTGTAGGTAYAACGGEWWGYDTPETVTAKMRYARERSLGGAFAWELSGDTATAELLTAMADGLSRS
jgi:chitinase